MGSEQCNILISPSALSSLLADKRAVGGGKSTVVSRHLENTTKNAKTVRMFAVWVCCSESCFGISLELKQLAIFQLPVSSFHIVSLFSLQVSVDVVLLLH